jgi:hypothetical protein
MPKPKKPRPRAPAIPAQPRPELHDWRGFTARRHRPEFGSLAFLALAAVVSVLVVAWSGAPRDVREAWMLSLVFVQLLVVDECHERLRPPARWLLPLASALAVPALLWGLLDARWSTTGLLAGVFLALVFVPRRWLDRFDAWRA